MRQRFKNNACFCNFAERLENMNKNKKSSKHIKSQSAAAPKAVDVKKKHWWLWKIPFYPLLFLLLWIFCSGVYGSVFYMSQQTSYFAWDATLMNFLLSQDWGWLYAVGRFLLLGYHYPIFGGAILALMLTLCSWLLDCIIGLAAKWRFVVVLPPFAFLAYFVALNYSVNYHRETSLLMAIPFAAVVVLGIIAVVKRIVSCKGMECPWKIPPGYQRELLVSNIGAVVVFAAITVFCVFLRDDLVRTCRMMRMLENSDWEGMIDEALGARRPSRSVAAYYAIALAETGQLESRAFEIPYNFPRGKVVEMDGQLSDGITIYTLDADFYAGLPNVSYHNSMETIVKNGPQLFLLKRMARAAAINGEKRLCWKYLAIIDRNPFEHKFVERYKQYISSTKAMLAEPEFAHVVNKMPVYDDFEQSYRSPMFLGYNVALREGNSEEALNASAMATLYSKDLDGFLMRARLFGNANLPEYYKQAVMLKSLKDKRILRYFPTINSEMEMARLRSFVKVAKPYLRKKEEGRKILGKDWGNYYPYYMYFENIPTEEQVKEHEQEEGGVN